MIATQNSLFLRRPHCARRALVTFLLLPWVLLVSACDPVTLTLFGVGSATAWHFQEGGRELAVPIEGRLTTNHARAGIEACVAGLGFGMFLSYQVEPDVRAGRLTRVLRDFEPEPWPVSLVVPGARLMSARLRAFLDWMRPRLRARRELA